LKLEAFELANKLITIAPEHCIAFERSLTKGRLGGIVDEWSITRNSYLEQDFADQQKRLAVLRSQRESFQDGSEAARHSDKNIIATENLILSYETLRYYEFANTP